MKTLRHVCLMAACILLLVHVRGAPAEGGNFEGPHASVPDGSFGIMIAQSLAAGEENNSAKSQSPGDESIKVRLEDLELVDQDSRKVKFVSDVIGDKIAVVIPFYTTCTTNYPILVFTLKRLQDLLGERLGREVALVSVSVDPRTDIPIRLKAFARRNHARQGWTFLTGERNNLGQVLWGIGVIYSTNLEEHNHIPITMVGSSDGGWKRLHGFPSPEQLLSQVNALLAARQGP